MSVIRGHSSGIEVNKKTHEPRHKEYERWRAIARTTCISLLQLLDRIVKYLLPIRSQKKRCAFDIFSYSHDWASAAGPSAAVAVSGRTPSKRFLQTRRLMRPDHNSGKNRWHPSELAPCHVDLRNPVFRMQLDMTGALNANEAVICLMRA